jgi:AraC-like DNA-binding protein
MASTSNVIYYLPVNDKTLDWGVYVTSIGRFRIGQHVRYPFEDHPDMYRDQWERGRILPEFAVDFITDGEGVFESKLTGQVRVLPGDVIFLFPGVWHRYKPSMETGWTERWMCLNGTMMHHLMEQGLVSPKSAVRASTSPQPIERAFDELLNLIYLNPSQNSVLLSLHALGLLATVINATNGDELSSALEVSSSLSKTKDSLISQAIAIIWTRSHHDISVPRIAKALGVPRRTLERRFQAALGHSVLAEISACRLSRAKRLLIETELPTKTITGLAGFSSEERMRATFVEQEGVPPSQFRRQARGLSTGKRGQ